MPSALPSFEADFAVSLDGQSTFEVVFEELRKLQDAGQVIDDHVAACLVADSPRVDRHKVYGQGCLYLINLGLLDEAEELAARALRAAPDCGGGCHLFGDVYKARGDEETAKWCYRYQLPDLIINKHFPLPEAKKTTVESVTNLGTNKLESHPADSYRLPLPVRVESREIPKLERSSLDIAGNPAYTARISGGRVWFDGLQLTLWDREQRVFTDLCRGNPEVINSIADPGDALYLPGRACMLGNRNAHNFYHWMNDVLPALDVVMASGIALESIDNFILNPVNSKFQKQTLAHFGIGKERIHQIGSGRHVRCDELLVPRYGSNSLGMSQSRWLAKFMQREFLYRDINPDQLPSPHRRIYVSRADSGVRGISNEAELLEFLKPWGFEVIRAAELTIQQQARVFAESEFVLGPHGAAFSNVLLCQPGSKLIELVNTHFETCFWAAAAMCEMEYYVVSHQPQPDVEVEGESRIQKTIRQREANFEVDIPEVEMILAAAGCLVNS